MKQCISAFIATLILWVLLTWSEIQEQGYPPLAVGLLAAFIVAVLSRNLFPAVSLHPRRVVFFLVYIPALLWEIIKSNLDVAYRVLHPRMPINPGIVRVPVSLQSDYGRTLLANSITLTPGTLTLDVVGTNFYVHWLNIQTYNPQEAAEMITGRFMRFLNKVFS
ncbi:MAG: Na+/H+ antiporter subunit E [Theionarchaea archaeon]|nr:Na+/H+ antiporter subunit E [Theionarchaea archaeon]MBU7038276.1 Na+/H+ antiporter subunit E [Theionarchaea archaeon]